MFTGALNRYLLIAAGVVLAVAIGGYLFERGNAIQAAAQRDAALLRVADLEMANAANQKTIAELIADREVNEKLIADYIEEIKQLQMRSADLAGVIQRLRESDAHVKSYLDTPIPDALRGVLNNGRTPADPD
jgi:hypothetical protein